MILRLWTDGTVPPQRIDYVLEVWTDLGGIRWTRTSAPASADLQYGEAPRTAAPFLRAMGWPDDGFPAEGRWHNVPVLFVHGDSGSLLPYDPIAATLWLLAEGEKYASRFPRDARGRYDETAEWVVRSGAFRRPVIHYWLRQLVDVLGVQWRVPHRLRVRPTIDVDMPWGFRHRPLVRRLLKAFRNRILRPRVWWTADDDPYDPCQWWRQLPRNTTFFVLDGGEDHPWPFESPPYTRLLRNLQEEGFEVALHGSFRSGNDPTRWRTEKRRLEQILQQPIRKNRQHFLHYRLPHTYRTMADEGIEEDYTTCGSAFAGFKHGIARPFRWYDWAADRPTDLRRVPTLWMDRALMRVTTPNEVGSFVQRLFHEAEQWNGDVAILAHNALWAAMGEWRQWREALLPWFREQT